MPPPGWATPVTASSLAHTLVVLRRLASAGATVIAVSGAVLSDGAIVAIARVARLE
jgi:hypothetical protein